ncbi:DNA mismatch repair protein MutS [Pontibacter sp. KCTC 32443]|uniref:MutS-related protein n=1 Tax=Pontibacter TaxID=323449 RepID=UPI00164EC5C9|nr:MULTISPECIES: DNA mismatch repair protein MutS [Pontibacter]MBC5774041.1 DNA mismatch repair protein MutS [Pontibacter sp. KCTC 32443]
MQHNPTEIYTSRATTFKQQEQLAAGKASRVSWLRVFIFVAGVAAAYHFFNTGNSVWGALTIGIGYTLFILVMRWHTRLEYQRQHLKLLHELNLEELDRLKGNISKLDSGHQFTDDHHPYTSDLDIFGPNSLFQLINRSVTSIGKAKLAGWLQHRAAKHEVLHRQEAVAELGNKNAIEWLQNLLATPRHYKHTEDSKTDFFVWLQENHFFSKHTYLQPLIFILPVGTLAAIVAWFYGYSGYPAVGLLVVQSLLSYRFRVERDEFYENSIGIYESMQSYTRQLQHIEQHQFKAYYLKELQHKLHAGNVKASVALGKLALIIDFFSYRLSTLMAFFLNTILMWDFIWVYRLEKWREKYLDQVKGSLDVLASFESIASIAAHQFANPAHTVPEISDVPFEFSAEQLAHPLIFASERIANDFSMQGVGHTIIVTGSNMSGKTTFLRTVGINMVLAFAGAPVCARKLRVAPVQVYTAMRTVDNLAESTSSFYAELKRLRILLNMTEHGEPVFYLLDEILKGTNSRDRHLGAMALIRQLHQRYSSGMISTHDLELGAMEEELAGSVENYSFNSTIEGDRILFDYKLQRGICGSFNASKLMQLMGIAIEE